MIPVPCFNRWSGDALFNTAGMVHIWHALGMTYYPVASMGVSQKAVVSERKSISWAALLRNKELIVIVEKGSS